MYSRKQGRPGINQTWREIEKLRQDNAELSASVDRIRRMHNDGESDFLAPGKWCVGCGEEYPCTTIRILRGEEAK